MAKDQGKPPSRSKARMMRPQPEGTKPGKRVEDPKEAYTPEQLQEIGAVALSWNQVDVFIDWLFQKALNLDFRVGWDVAARMGSAEAKLEIMRLVAARSKILNEDAEKAIKFTLDGVSEYKKYRDNVVHSVPYDIERGIAHRATRQAKLIQSLVTLDALTGLYRRIKFLLNELREVDLLYRLADEEDARKVYAGRESDPLKRRRIRDVPLQTARLRLAQQSRVSLPPLPEFPDEAEDPTEMELSERHLRFEEGRPEEAPKG